MNQLYSTIGISKQAVHQKEYRQTIFEEKLVLLLSEVDLIRKEHPGCGLEKLYYTLTPDFIGRDQFIELFRELGYKLSKRRNFKRTTYSSPSNYPNLIMGMKVNAPSIIWQSDITYISVNNRFYYAVFIIDVYTKKIVGYQVSDHMRAEANVKALSMALEHNRAPIIHHSDRGSQYVYKGYIELLLKNNCQISMSKSAQENAYAERINRTIKEEYLQYWNTKDFKQLRLQVKKAVEQYNSKRIHNNLRRISPINFEEMWIKNNIKIEFNIFENIN